MPEVNDLLPGPRSAHYPAGARVSLRSVPNHGTIDTAPAQTDDEGRVQYVPVVVWLSPDQIACVQVVR